MGVTAFVEIKLLSGVCILTLFTNPSVQVVAFQRYVSTSEVPAARTQVGVFMRVVIKLVFMQYALNRRIL